MNWMVLQLGLNDTKDRGDNDGEVGDLLPEVALGSNLEAVAVTAGLRHTAAIMSDGSVRSWGYNRKGQLGVATILDVGDGPNEMGDNMSVTPLGGVTPVSITAGGWHTCAIVDDDKLKCWGKRADTGSAHASFVVVYAINSIGVCVYANMLG